MVTSEYFDGVLAAEIVITVTALASTSSTIPRAISPARSFYRAWSPGLMSLRSPLLPRP